MTTSVNMTLFDQQCGPEPAEISRLREDATPDNPEACYALGLALQSAGAADPSDEALHWFATATMGDHPGGHYQMALYYRGLNDQRMASDHLESSAFQGFEPALKLARDWKIAGYLDFADDEEAIELLEEGVSRGIHEARYRLAVRLTEGRGIQLDPHRVAALYAQGAKGGHRGSMRGLAACYRSGYGIAANEDAALHWYSQAAGRGDPEAWLALGGIYSKEGEHEVAVRCFECAARSGNKDALFALALAHGRGQGVPRDDRQMRSLTARAAEAGHPEAQYRLGNYHRFGEGEFEQDLERAVHWYERASFSEHPMAIYGLGLHTLLGHGVEQDIRKGWELIEKAAKLGAVDAMMCMATMIASGQAPVDDPSEALNWYQRAADQGNAEAQFITAQRMLEIPNDKRFARDYLTRAAAQGNPDAKALLESIGEEPRAVAAAAL